MKKNVITLLVLLFCLFTVSCVENQPDDTPDISTITSDNTTDATNLETQAPSDPPIGGTNICTIHLEGYHTYPLTIMRYVGEEKFYKWIDEREETSDTIVPYSGCNLYNFYSFIDYFEISKEQLIEWYNTGVLEWYHDIDPLYNGSAEEIEQHYRNTDELEIEREKRRYFDQLKIDIIANNTNVFGMTTNYRTHSLIELMMRAGYKDIKEVKAIGNYERGYEFDYNENILSSFAEKSIDEIIEKYTPYYLDCLVCGVTPYNTPYERQVALNAEKDQ